MIELLRWQLQAERKAAALSSRCPAFSLQRCLWPLGKLSAGDRRIIRCNAVEGDVVACVTERRGSASKWSARAALKGAFMHSMP